MIKVKICGITNSGDALASADAGSSALGFVFYKKSPRYIRPEEAKDIIKELPKRLIKIGVFVNESEKKVRRIAGMCGLDMLQFHGDESPGFCKRFKDYKVIKVFKIKDKIDLQNILRYKTFAYLFDTFVKTEIGGTGKRFNWELIKNIGKIKQPIFLSGGLTAKNVKGAIKIVKPDWVDVSSGVEIKPGKKEHKKVKEFIEVVQTINSTS